MKQTVDVHLFGSLRSKTEKSDQNPARLLLEIPIPIHELLQRLGIQKGWVQLVMINNRSVYPDSLVRPGDRVALFPAEYPVFMDWNDHRLGKNQPLFPA